jgi:3-hydroxyisobutyrate dehydrogenase-like beta-hydroxyacid dehydrogenase
MVAVPGERLAEADFVLSIVPPAAAPVFAERMAEWLGSARSNALFVDCNAVSPETVGGIARTIGATGADFADAGIIGGPPREGVNGPNIYVSGPHAGRVGALARYGLEIRVLEAPIGAASALKMSYAGITKGLIAVGTAMLLAAARGGVADALHAELAESQRALLTSFERTVPAMFPKAYRWVAEMQEIARFAHEDTAAARLFEAASELYRRLASDVAGAREEAAALETFLRMKQARP